MMKQVSRRYFVPKLNAFNLSSSTSPKRNYMTQTTPITNTIKIIDPKSYSIRPMYQILDAKGNCSIDKQNINKDEILHIYRVMNRVRIFDEIMNNIQRQGIISFYLQNTGEEGLQVGSSSCLTNDDMIFFQYRETGVLFYRGFTVQQALDQCLSTEDDLGKGRQMPIHYGSRELNIQTVSSPLATQLPASVGAAFAFKYNSNHGKPDRVVVSYFGDGAASEGDFHAAMNFAATLEVPIVFFCRNNGYAISTNTSEQFRGDGIATRAIGYGIKSIRVDGNDTLAVKEVTALAKHIAMENCCPVLIEAMTYRMSHHSTSDDSTKYRDASEIEYWQSLCPLLRLKLFLMNQKWWDEESDVNMKKEERDIIIQSLERTIKKPKVALKEMFTDVYKDLPPHLLQQKNDLELHIRKYPEHYTK